MVLLIKQRTIDALHVLFINFSGPQPGQDVSHLLPVLAGSNIFNTLNICSIKEKYFKLVISREMNRIGTVQRTINHLNCFQ